MRDETRKTSDLINIATANHNQSKIRCDSHHQTLNQLVR